MDDYGDSLCKDPARLKGFLLDFCGEYPREIRLLLWGVEQKIPHSLLEQEGRYSSMFLFPNLKARLEINLCITQEASAWVVESWAEALGNGPPVRFSCRMLLSKIYSFLKGAFKRVFRVNFTKKKGTQMPTTTDLFGKR